MHRLITAISHRNFVCASCTGMTQEKFGNFSNKGLPSHTDFEFEALLSSARFDIELLMSGMFPFSEDWISSLHPASFLALGFLD
jgi:hypothetical protein